MYCRIPLIRAPPKHRSSITTPFFSWTVQGQSDLSQHGHFVLSLQFLMKYDFSRVHAPRKYPYPYHGRHLGIPKGRGGYVDWNSEGEGGLRRLEFRGHGGGGHWTGIPKAYGGFQESNFQFGVVKSLQEKLVKNDLSKDDDSLVNTRHVQLNQHAGDTFQWSWSIKCLC